MKIQYYLVLLAGLVSVFLVAAECGSYTLVPQKIEEQASWATLNNSEWQFRWKDSPRDQNPRFVYDSRIEMDVSSRATAWFNQSREIGALLLATPDISVAGFSQNPFKTQSDEWIIREVARQGGPTARRELGITFDPATVPLQLEETVSAPTNLGITMKGSRFLAQTPQGDGYVIVLRGTHQKDLLVLVAITHPLSASRQADSTARLIRHPSSEPSTQPAGVTTVSPEGMTFVRELEGLHTGPVEDPYNDSEGHCTIGYGHLVHKENCFGSQEEIALKNRITREGPEPLFKEDLEQRSMQYVRAYVTVPLSQSQFDALTSYTLNRGGGNLKILVDQTQVNQRNYQMVPLIMLSDEHIPSTIPVLEGRRCDEAELFQTGDYSVQRKNPCPLRP